MSTIRELFGGAITAILPGNLVDASNFRQVPDTQELLLFPETNISLVIEVLEKVDREDLIDATKFHFESVAHDNDAQGSIVQSVELLSAEGAAPDGSSTPTVTTLQGTQKVTKYNSTILDDVLILLALWRIPNKNVDLVLTFNVPLTAADGLTVDEAGQQQTKKHFDEAVLSLKIVDYGLFA